jgi:hypothetical protein
MINNLTYRSVDEAAKLGGNSLRVFGRLVAHRIDAVMCNVRWPVAESDVPSAGPVPLVRADLRGDGYDDWFARY